jgi:O-antigen/teichoic acid export membrane protein
VLLARWLSPQEYGAFAVALALFLLLGALQIALLIEPMLIFGQGTYGDRLSAYVSLVLYGHWMFAALGSLLLLVVGLGCWWAGLSVLSLALVSLTLASPFILLLWLLRGMCYLQVEKLSLAVASGGVYLALVGAGIGVLYGGGWLSAASGLGVMGMASGMAGVWLAARLAVNRPSFGDQRVAPEVWGRHWRYGRWSAATYALIWMPENVYYLLLPVWGGLEASAALKALMNLLVPLLRTYAALSPLLLITLARAQTPARSSQVRVLLYGFAFSAVLYWLLLGLFAQPILSGVYGEQYQDYEALLWLLGVFPLVTGVTAVLSGTLRALERPDQVFWAQALATLVTLTVGVGLMAVWGVSGAVGGLCLSGSVGALTMGVFYHHLQRSPLEDAR